MRLRSAKRSCLEACSAQQVFPSSVCNAIPASSRSREFPPSKPVASRHNHDMRSTSTGREASDLAGSGRSWGRQPACERQFTGSITLFPAPRQAARSSPIGREVEGYELSPRSRMLLFGPGSAIPMPLPDQFPRGRCRQDAPSVRVDAAKRPLSEKPMPPKCPR